MPTLALHSQYWQTQGGAPPDPPGVSGQSGYPAWQAVILSQGSAAAAVLLLVYLASQR